jgi:hypothetical protein
MTILIAYRRRGSPVWDHRFYVSARQWKSFYRQARKHRRASEYARVVCGEYVAVLA